MSRTPQNVQLTPLQIAHTITALRAHIRVLEQKGDNDPEGGEYEDVLIAESILKTLSTAGTIADDENRKAFAGHAQATSDDWALPVAVLSSFPTGLSREQLSRHLQSHYKWPAARAEAAIDEAIRRGEILASENGLLVASGAALDEAIDPPSPADDGPG